jgi:DNA-binding NarL/FixJ family response regulator
MVVDDHPLVIDAVRMVLLGLDPSAMIDEAGTLSAATATVAATRPDLILLDLGLPDSEGAGTVSSLRAAAPDVPIAVFSGVVDPAEMLAALDSGAMAFIPKSLPRAAMIGALEDVFVGRGYMPPSLVGDPLASPPAATDSGEIEFTERQREVLALLVLGISNKGISQRLAISENTVKVHVSAIFRMLGVSNRIQAVLAAYRRGHAVPRISD